MSNKKKKSQQNVFKIKYQIKKAIIFKILLKF